MEFPACEIGRCTSVANFLRVKREKIPKRRNNHMFIINFCLNMFRASLCSSSGEQGPCVTAYGVLRWFCWMWLVAVVGRCVVGCEHSQCSHPNDPYRGRTAPLTSKRRILYIYSTNTVTEYFKHGIHSPFFPLQNAVCFIILTYLVPVLLTFYIQVC